MTNLLKPKRILVIEDEPKHLRDAAAILSRVGVSENGLSDTIFFTSTCARGAMVLEEKVDGIITDIRMPTYAHLSPEKKQPHGFNIALRAKEMGIPVSMVIDYTDSDSFGNYHSGWRWVSQVAQQLGIPTITRTDTEGQKPWESAYDAIMDDVKSGLKIPKLDYSVIDEKVPNLIEVCIRPRHDQYNTTSFDMEVTYDMLQKALENYIGIEQLALCERKWDMAKGALSEPRTEEANRRISGVIASANSLVQCAFSHHIWAQTDPEPRTLAEGDMKRLTKNIAHAAIQAIMTMPSYRVSGQEYAINALREACK